MDQTVKHELEIKKRVQEDAFASAKNILKQLERAKLSAIDVEPEILKTARKEVI